MLPKMWETINMRKIQLNNGVVVDEHGTPVICCVEHGAPCDEMCAAYSEGMTNTGVIKETLVAKCNAFKFTIGEL